MKTIIAVALAAATATAHVAPALAQETFKVTPERRGLLVSIIEDLGCKVNAVSPPPAFLDAMKEHNFVRAETNAIATQLYDEGLAVRDGQALVLRTGKCS